MVEGGNAEKFPNEWDIQILGNIVASQLASGLQGSFGSHKEMFVAKLIELSMMDKVVQQVC